MTKPALRNSSRGQARPPAAGPPHRIRPPQLRRRLFEHLFRKVCIRPGLQYYDSKLDWNDSELPELMSCAVQALEEGWEKGSALVQILGQRARVNGHYAQSRYLHSTLFNASRDNHDGLGRAWALFGLAEIDVQLTNLAEAESKFRQLLRLTDRLRSPQLTADALAGLAAVAVMRRDEDEARRHNQEALRIRRQLGDRTGEAICLVGLAVLDLKLGNSAAAASGLQRAFDLAHEVESRTLQANIVHAQGELACEQGEYRKAALRFRHAARLSREIGNMPGLARALYQYGLMAFFLGKVEVGCMALRDARWMYEEMGLTEALASVKKALDVFDCGTELGVNIEGDRLRR